MDHCLDGRNGVVDVWLVPVLPNPWQTDTWIEYWRRHVNIKVIANSNKGLTHGNYISIRAVHLFVVFSCPLKANVNPWLEVFIPFSKLFPSGHEHLKGRYGSRKDWGLLTRHRLLYCMWNLRDGQSIEDKKDSYLLLTFNTASKSWRTAHSFSVSRYLTMSLLRGVIRK